MEKSLRQVLREHPNSGQRVIGAGTVHVDPDKIRRSQSYKKLVAQVRHYAKTGEKPKNLKLDDSLVAIDEALDRAIENTLTAAETIRETLERVDSPEVRAEVELEVRAEVARQDGWLEEIRKLMRKGSG